MKSPGGWKVSRLLLSTSSSDKMPDRPTERGNVDSGSWSKSVVNHGGRSSRKLATLHLWGQREVCTGSQLIPSLYSDHGMVPG